MNFSSEEKSLLVWICRLSTSEQASKNVVRFGLVGRWNRNSGKVSRSKYYYTISIEKQKKNMEEVSLVGCCWWWFCWGKYTLCIKRSGREQYSLFSSFSFPGLLKLWFGAVVLFFVCGVAFLSTFTFLLLLSL